MQCLKRPIQGDVSGTGVVVPICSIRPCAYHGSLLIRFWAAGSWRGSVYLARHIELRGKKFAAYAICSMYFQPHNNLPLIV